MGNRTRRSHHFAKASKLILASLPFPLTSDSRYIYLAVSVKLPQPCRHYWTAELPTIFLFINPSRLRTKASRTKKPARSTAHCTFERSTRRWKRNYVDAFNQTRIGTARCRFAGGQVC